MNFPPTSQQGPLQYDTTNLSRDLPDFLEFLRTPTVDMKAVDRGYGRLGNGRIVVTKRLEVEEMPTEAATVVDASDFEDDILVYFDTDVEFGEQDMEIEEDCNTDFSKILDCSKKWTPRKVYYEQNESEGAGNCETEEDVLAMRGDDGTANLHDARKSEGGSSTGK